MLQSKEIVLRNGWIGLKSLAEYLSRSVDTIRRWGVTRTSYPRGFPAGLKIGRRWSWKIDEINKWEEDLRRRQKERRERTGQNLALKSWEILDFIQDGEKERYQRK